MFLSLLDEEHVSDHMTIGVSNAMLDVLSVEQ